MGLLLILEPEQLLHDLADGELDAERSADAQALLADDAEARRYLRQLLADKRYLMGLGGSLADEPVPERLAAFFPRCDGR